MIIAMTTEPQFWREKAEPSVTHSGLLQEVKDVQEQLRDVMFYLEAQQTISAESAETQQEIQEGHIIIGAAANPPGQGGRKGRKKDR